MKIRNILLTGDDGYNSIGTRVIIHHLKKKYNLFLAATKLQQSGIGGKLSLNHPVHWDNVESDGVKGFSVDGTPCDAIELAREYFKTVRFDLVISGINLGVNIGGTFPSSGTFSAAERALILQITKKSIALSLHVEDSSHYLKTHDGVEDISSYINYPGNAAYQLIEKAIQNNFWENDLLNVNFPFKETNKVRFTRPLKDLTTFFNYPLRINKAAQTFSYPFEVKKNTNSIDYDTGAVLEGYISVTPCKIDSVNESAYRKLKNETVNLK